MNYLTRFPVRCPCGRLYTERQWRMLRFVGDQVDDIEHLELRDCESCHSTRSLRVERQTEVELSAEGRAELAERLVSDVEPLLSHERDVR